MTLAFQSLLDRLLPVHDYLLGRRQGALSAGLLRVIHEIAAEAEVQRAPGTLRRVILESPLAGAVERNLRYARAAMRHALDQGEAPLASHLLYAQAGILDDTVPAERTRGIAAGLAWGRAAEATVVYVDQGISDGMRTGIIRAHQERRPVEFRTLPLAYWTEERDLIWDGNPRRITFSWSHQSGQDPAFTFRIDPPVDPAPAWEPPRSLWIGTPEHRQPVEGAPRADA